MIGEHFLWWLLTMACVLWYSTITIYVAIRGAADIKAMLTRLAEQKKGTSTALRTPTPSGPRPRS
jgi:hypothetical protein